MIIDEARIIIDCLPYFVSIFETCISKTALFHSNVKRTKDQPETAKDQPETNRTVKTSMKKCRLYAKMEIMILAPYRKE